MRAEARRMAAAGPECRASIPLFPALYSLLSSRSSLHRAGAMIGLTEGEGMTGAPGLPDEVHDAFSASGLLAKSPDFEFRQEQQQLAVAVAEAIQQGNPLVRSRSSMSLRPACLLLKAVLTHMCNFLKAQALLCCALRTTTINSSPQFRFQFLDRR